MGLYKRYVLPRLIDFASSKPTRKQREEVVPLAEGDVLEIGMGRGLNVGARRYGTASSYRLRSKHRLHRHPKLHRTTLCVTGPRNQS